MRRYGGARPPAGVTGMFVKLIKLPYHAAGQGQTTWSLTSPWPKPGISRHQMKLDLSDEDLKHTFWVRMDESKTIRRETYFQSVATHSLCGCHSGAIVRMVAKHGAPRVYAATLLHKTTFDDTYRNAVQRYNQAISGKEGGTTTVVSFAYRSEDGQSLLDELEKAGLKACEHALIYHRDTRDKMAWGLCLDGRIGELDSDWCRQQDKSGQTNPFGEPRGRGVRFYEDRA
jgi:hypothetical protein